MKKERFYSMKHHADYPFQLALCSSNYLMVFDERYPKDPLLNWIHQQNYDLPVNIFQFQSDLYPGESNLNILFIIIIKDDHFFFLIISFHFIFDLNHFLNYIFTNTRKRGEVTMYQYTSNNDTMPCFGAVDLPFCMSVMTETSNMCGSQRVFDLSGVKHSPCATLEGCCIIVEEPSSSTTNPNLYLFQINNTGDLYCQTFTKLSNSSEPTTSQSYSTITTTTSTAKRRKLTDKVKENREAIFHRDFLTTDRSALRNYHIQDLSCVLNHILNFFFHSFFIFF
jgi:hypothetical protein